MLVGHWPLQENSGNAYDHTGNGNDALTVSGVTQGQTGLLGNTAYSFDGTDDYVELPNNGFWNNSGVISSSFWMNPSTAPSNSRLTIFDNNDKWTVTYDREDNQGVNIGVYGDNHTFGSEYSTGTWHHVYVQWDIGNQTTATINGIDEGVYSTGNGHDGDNQVLLGNATDGSTVQDKNVFNGKLAEFRAYNRRLSPLEIQYLYDVGTTGTILTETKTHGSSIKPDLRADVTLNSQSATAFIIGSPGTSSEETKSVSLSAGSNDYTLSWSNSHTDFRVEVEANISDVTQRVQVNRAVLLG